MKKQAFFVMGPESSGTRLLTRILIDAGCYGQSSHHQEMDGYGYRGTFAGMPERIVFRRSVPHAHEWPPISDLVRKLRQAGYTVTVLITVRDLEATARSQLAHGHTFSMLKAYGQIERANQHIMAELDRCNPTPSVVMVPYEAGILHRESILALLRYLALLPVLQVDLTDQNGKHYV